MGSNQETLAEGDIEGSLPTLNEALPGTLLLPGPAIDHDQDVPQAWQDGDVILGLYEVRAVLGKGGFGTVHLVRHRGWNRLLAVKTLNPELAASPQHREAFKRECQEWSGLGLHPNIVTCHYVRELGGLLRIFSEYMKGGSLEEWLERHPAPDLEAVLDFALQCLEGLAFAHQNGLVHRDVKPANCLLADAGVLKITDFGIASGLRSMEATRAVGGARATTLLEGGAVGTPAYMPPEQWDARHGEVGPWSDIYALGVMLFEACCGERPFDDGSDDVAVVKMRHLAAEPPDPCEIRPDLPRPLADFIGTCLKKRTDERFADCAQAWNALASAHAAILGKPYARERASKLVQPADSLNNRAVSLVDLGLVEEALGVWDQALATDALHLQSTFNRTLVRWRSGLCDDVTALEAVHHVAKERPAQWEAEYFAGLIHLEREDCASARESLERAGSHPEVAFALERARVREASSTRTIAAWPLGNIDCHACLLMDAGLAFVGCTDGAHVLYPDTGRYRHVIGSVQGARGIGCVAVTAEGRHALTGGLDGPEVGLWDIGGSVRHADGSPGISKMKRTEPPHFASRITHVAISPDGRWAAYVAPAKTLEGKTKWAEVPVLWDVESGLFRIEPSALQRIHPKPHEKQALGPFMNRPLTEEELHGACLQVFGADWTDGPDPWQSQYPELKRLADGRQRPLKSHKSAVSALCFSLDGTRLASGDARGTIHVWDVKTGRCLATLNHGAPVKALAVIHGTCHLLSACNTLIKTWSLDRFECVSSAPHFHRRELRKLAATRDGTMLFTMGDDGLKLRRPGGKVFRTFGESSTERTCNHAVNSDGTRVLGIWSGQNGPAQGCTWQVAEFRLAPQAGLALSAVRDAAEVQAAERQHMALVERARELLAQERWQEAIAALVDAGKTPGYSHSLEAFDLWKSLYRRASKTDVLATWNACALQSHQEPIFALARDGRGRLAATASSDAVVRVWDIASGMLVKEFPAGWGAIHSLSMSRDGSLVAAAHREGCVRVYRTDTGECDRNLVVGKEVSAESVILSDDGRVIVSGSSDLAIRFWDAKSGACVGRLLHPGTPMPPRPGATAEPPLCLLLAADRPLETLLSAKAGTHSVHVWDLSAGKVRDVLEWEEAVMSLCMTPDGRHALIGGERGTVTLWDLAMGQARTTCRGPQEAVAAVALSLDARWAISGTCGAGRHHALHLWNLETGTLARSIDSHRDGISGVAMSPDGAWLISTGWDKTVRFQAVQWALEMKASALMDETVNLVLKSWLDLWTPPLKKEGRGPDDRAAVLTRRGKPRWSDHDFDDLMFHLGCAGRGALDPREVLATLDIEASLREQVAVEIPTLPAPVPTLPFPVQTSPPPQSQKVDFPLPERKALFDALASRNRELARSLLEKAPRVDVVDDAKKSLLHHAVQAGFTDLAGILLDRGADPNREDRDSRGALHYALEAGDVLLSRLLLERGASPHYPGFGADPPLHYAVRSGSRELVELLLSRGVDVNCSCFPKGTALHQAIRVGSLPIVELLVARGADLEALTACDTPLMLAVQGGQVAMVDLLTRQGALIRTYSGDFPRDIHVALPATLREGLAKPLEIALDKGNLEMALILFERGGKDTVPAARLKAIMEQLQIRTGFGAMMDRMFKKKKGVDPVPPENQRDAEGKTPLHRAVQCGDAAGIRRLLDQGANPNLRDFPQSGRKDRSGSAPLHYAVQRADVESVRILLDHHADPNLVDNEGRTPLQAGAVEVTREIAERLVERGASLTVRTARKEALVHLAVMACNASFLQFLIERGADLGAREGEHGFTPLELARSGKKRRSDAGVAAAMSVCELLERAKAAAKHA